MSRETEVKAQLTELGVYNPSFDPAIHEYCIQVRELSRMRKQFKGEGSDYTSKLHDRIDRKVALIADLETRLGLNPTGLVKLRRSLAPSEEAQPIAGSANAAFAQLLSSLEKEAAGEGEA